MTRTQAHLWIAFCALLSSANFIFSKFGISELPPLAFLSWRFIVATLVLLPFIAPTWRQITARDLRVGLLNGAFFAIGGVLLYVGLPHVGSGEAAFIIGTTVLWVPIIDLVLFRRRPSRFEIMGVAVGFVGLVLLNLRDGFSIHVASLWCLASALVYALWVVVLSRVALGGVARNGAFLQVLSAAIICTAWGAMTGVLTAQASNEVWLALLYMGALSTGLRMVLQVWAQRFTTATQAELIYTIEPIGALVWGLVFAAESLTWLQLLGCGVILSGVVVAQRR